MTNETIEPPIDIDAAAAMLGVGVRFVRRLCQERRVRYIRMGGNKVRFLPSDLMAFVNASAVEPSAAHHSAEPEVTDSG